MKIGKLKDLFDISFKKIRQKELEYNETLKMDSDHLIIKDLVDSVILWEICTIIILIGNELYVKGCYSRY